MIADFLLLGFFLYLLASIINWVVKKGGVKGGAEASLGCLAAGFWPIFIAGFLAFIFLFGGWMWVIQWVLDFFDFIFG